MGEIDLARMPLFDGLDEAALAAIRAQMRPRRFPARSFICRQGEGGNSLFVIQHGLAQVLFDEAEGAVPKPRLRRGDIIGEISLLTGEPRSASVRASVTTEALELSQEAFAAIVARYPAILINLSRIVSRRLAHANVQPSRSRSRGEAVALVVGQSGAALVAEVIEATRAASAGSLAALDLTASLPSQDVPLAETTVEGVLTVLDDLLAAHSTVVIVVDPRQENLALLLEHADRTIVLGNEAEAQRPAAIIGRADTAADLMLLTEHPPQAARSVGGLRVVRAFDPDHADTREAGGRDIAWLGRHLSRTKLGLALGAGGAKGYAHVGALHALEEAGYTVDYVAGSSIGALIGAWLAMGMDATEIEATMRRTFTPETTAIIFSPSASGVPAGWQEMARLWRETTDRRAFSDLQIPFVAMAVDLNTGLPAPIKEGPLWEALLASTAVPGLYPPYERGGQRLVDGVALVPVPTESVMAAGADITLSVNLMNRESRSAWPGESPSEPRPVERSLRTLDALMDVMELTWRDSSTRYAGLADVVITPRFGPGSWRAFHLADRFMAAGYEAAKAQLGSLRALARPLPLTGLPRGSAGSAEAVADGRAQRGTPPQPVTFEDVRAILVNLIGLQAGKLPDDPSVSFEELGLDSIALLEAQIELEQRYGLRISHEDAQRLTTMGDVIEYVNRRVQDGM